MVNRLHGWGVSLHGMYSRLLWFRGSTTKTMSGNYGHKAPVPPTIRAISQAPSRAAAKRMNQSAKATRDQIPNSKGPGPSRKAMNKAKKGKKGGKAPREKTAVRLHPLLRSLALSRSNPFEHRGAEVPHTNNEAQSLTSFTTATTSQLAIVVPVGKCVQFCFFPMGMRGTGEMQNDNAASGPLVITPKESPGPGDAQAYHCRPVTFRDEIGAYNTVVIGPTNMSLIVNIAGVPVSVTIPGVPVIRSTVTSGFEIPVGLAESSFGNSVGGTTTRWNPVYYARQIPIVSLAEGHFRMVLVSCGVRWSRTTPGGTSGGYVTSVSLSQPVKNKFAYLAVGQQYFSAYPSYHVSAEDEGLFLPTDRPVDNAYSHAALTDTSYATVSNALVAEGCNTIEAANALLWLNNDTASAQHYQLEFVWNWQIGGDQVQTFCRPSQLAPQLAPAIVQAANKLSSASAVGPSHVMAAFSEAAKETSMGAVLSGIQRGVLDLASGFNLS